MLSNFRSELESQFKIFQWNPTQEQLIKIAEFIVQNPNNINHATVFICELCDDVLLSIFEGTDNSDLNHLLAMAKLVAKEGR
ncbi:hypothetical protein ACJJIW_12445 [Microbulbifer sp. JMSA004]|uniref:hypothetical protein n=1 Tax=Microbulbifer sp. JMSA004 TaxID=3243370 RepID=UPI00403A4B98